MKPESMGIQGSGLRLIGTTTMLRALQPSFFARLVGLNPVTSLLVTTRNLVTGMAIAQAEGFWLASGLAIVSLLLGWLVYRITMPIIIERMSA